LFEIVARADFGLEAQRLDHGRLDVNVSAKGWFNGSSLLFPHPLKINFFF